MKRQSLLQAKVLGFSDKFIAKLLNKTEAKYMNLGMSGISFQL